MAGLGLVIHDFAIVTILGSPIQRSPIQGSSLQGSGCAAMLWKDDRAPHQLGDAVAKNNLFQRVCCDFINAGPAQPSNCPITRAV